MLGPQTSNICLDIWVLYLQTTLVRRLTFNAVESRMAIITLSVCLYFDLQSKQCIWLRLWWNVGNPLLNRDVTFTVLYIYLSANTGPWHEGIQARVDLFTC